MVNSYFEKDRAKFAINKSIELIKSLNKKIVFEGIENKEQIDIVKKIDIDYIQGFYYTKPIPEDEFIKLIKTNEEKN